MKSQKLRVLLAENDITETGITLRALCADQGRGLELVFVSYKSKLFNTLLHSQPHIAFLALSMLQPDPPFTISLLHRAAPHIPLILFVQSADTACAVRCLHSGAENYMLEGFLDAPTLRHVLHTAIQRNTSTEAPTLLKSRLHLITNLPNRSGLQQQLQKSSQASVLSGSRLLISVRLSNLKKLQASGGQPGVERVLLQTAQQLRSLIRRSDLIAYVAPGVFALVIFDAGDSCRASLQRRIECSLVQPNQREYGKASWRASVLISSWDNTSPFSFTQILWNHLSVKKQFSSPSLALTGNSVSPPAVRSGP